MFAFLTKLLLVVRSHLKSRASLEAENIVLRQQVVVLSRKARSRLRLRNIDRLILVWNANIAPPISTAIALRHPGRGFRSRQPHESHPLERCAGFDGNAVSGYNPSRRETNCHGVVVKSVSNRRSGRSAAVLSIAVAAGLAGGARLSTIEILANGEY